MSIQQPLEPLHFVLKVKYIFNTNTHQGLMVPSCKAQTPVNTWSNGPSRSSKRIHQ
uniref:Uncharacterized protein n=1 Tax=Anguilla anguilla TaxID=7936 RepID=A0A0E9WB72_ANGAN